MTQPLLTLSDHSLLPADGKPDISHQSSTDLDWPLKTLFATDPHQACELLFRTYYASFCSHAVRLVYARETAEDIVSEVFCNFWKNKVYLAIDTSFQAYLFRAVRYRAYNYLRWEITKSRQSSDDRIDDVADSRSLPVEIMQYDELQRSIEKAIDELPPQCRRVFLLSRFEGRKYSEIADELNIALKTVEAHMSKALTQLRTVLKDEWVWSLALFFGLQA
ncbi:RNA polymerase sigma-70 factor [Spirosoma sp. KUDC1026]|uniref:RNA polymerase sigma-70 factor n=1 Tax=Spirosoma sp. KUDC1026 TaxID=2745947 RepID=UPI00159BE06B|nr:RNA polymerase sigma-70 factor [Spirosoma sp. KUDC1026]QKZ13617.1 RNA polymerase sigma-70 factor [Spirosoma sp. KUDC1026]